VGIRDKLRHKRLDKIGKAIDKKMATLQSLTNQPLTDSTKKKGSRITSYVTNKILKMGQLDLKYLITTRPDLASIFFAEATNENIIIGRGVAPEMRQHPIIKQKLEACNIDIDTLLSTFVPTEENEGHAFIVLVPAANIMYCDDSLVEFAKYIQQTTEEPEVIKEMMTFVGLNVKK
jgi:hypothetical protein